MSTQRLHKINKLSSDILLELEKKNPEVDNIQHLLDSRQAEIDVFLQGDSGDETTNRDQMEILFSEFTKLNKGIQHLLRLMWQHQKDQLFDATKKRRAEEGYSFLKKPDISYY